MEINKDEIIAKRAVHFYEKENAVFKKIDSVSMLHVPDVGNYFLLEKTQALFLVKDIIKDSSSVFVVVEKSARYAGIIKEIYQST